MSLRKDVYELLRLYEGPHPKEAFKPQLQPDDWRERREKQLVFRSQVPDQLEAAYDIALSEGYLRQGLLKPEQQVELYETLGTYDIPQDQPWPVVPGWSDALVFLTDKGRAAIALHDTKSTLLSKRVKVDLDAMTVELDGQRYDVRSEQALRWLKVLVEHPGEWLGPVELEECDKLNLLGVRTHRLKKHLPSKIQDLIESQTGRGSRINL